jgi:fatty acid desaturase
MDFVKGMAENLRNHPDDFGSWHGRSGYPEVITAREESVMFGPVLAFLAFVAFVVSLVVYGSVHGWVFWLLLGLALLALSAVAPAVEARRRGVGAP